MALLEIITRTFGKRPSHLTRCLRSVAQQTDTDYSHRVVMDSLERGVPWACRNLATIEATGDYVWVLDDDDVCAHPHLVADLRAIAAMHYPDIIMARTSHALYGTLPHSENWEREPVLGDIGTSNYLVRRDVWNANHDLWREEYAADYWFIHDLWARQWYRWYWHDMVIATYPQQSRGATYAF